MYEQQYQSPATARVDHNHLLWKINNNSSDGGGDAPLKRSFSLPSSSSSSASSSSSPPPKARVSESPAHLVEAERFEIVNLSGLSLDTLPSPALNLGIICKLDLSNNNLQVLI